MHTRLTAHTVHCSHGVIGEDMVDDDNDDNVNKEMVVVVVVVVMMAVMVDENLSGVVGRFREEVSEGETRRPKMCCLEGAQCNAHRAQFPSLQSKANENDEKSNCMERRTACCHRRRVTLYLHPRVPVCTRVTITCKWYTTRTAALACPSQLLRVVVCARHDRAASAIKVDCFNHSTFTDNKIGCVSR